MSEYAKGSGRVPTGFAAETFISEATFRAAHRAVEANPNAANAKKRKREAKGDSSIVDGPGAYKGPWAKYEVERPDAAEDDEYGTDVEVEYVIEEEEIEENPEAAPTKLAGTDYHDTEGEGERSEFVGSQEYDYQGRTYMHVPTGMELFLAFA
jgi:pre-mRNA-processing factor 17